MDRSKIIYDVLAGTAPEEKKQELEAWVAQSRGNREEYEDLRLLWDLSRSMEEGGRSRDYYEGLERIKIAIRARLGRRSRKLLTVRIAGVLACVAFAVYVMFNPVKNSQSQWLEFHNEPLQNVLQTIEREYKVEVRTEGTSLLQCRFTGVFYRIDQPDQVVGAISQAIKADVESTAPGRYKLKGRGCG